MVAMFIPHLIIMTLSGSGKEKLFKLRKLSLSKQDLNECMEITPHTPLWVMVMVYVRIKSLLNAASITAAHIRVSVAQEL
ncbi:hypothetical protein Tco_1227688 [Tanacetum coccineum]